MEACSELVTNSSETGRTFRSSFWTPMRVTRLSRFGTAMGAWLGGRSLTSEVAGSGGSAVSKRLREHLDREVERVDSIVTTEHRYRAADEAQKLCFAAIEALSEVKVAAIRQQLEQGYTLAELAEMYGISRERVRQIGSK